MVVLVHFIWKGYTIGMEWFDVTNFLTVAVPIGAMIAWFLKRLDRRFDAIDARFEKIDARFGKMDEKIDSFYKQLDSKIEDLRKDLSTTEKRLTDRMDDLYQKQSMEINSMSVRIGHIEGALFPYSWGERIPAKRPKQKPSE